MNRSKQLVLSVIAFTLAVTFTSLTVAQSAEPTAAAAPKPIPISEAEEVVLEGIYELGYQDAEGRYITDMYERDQTFLALRVTTPDGRPVEGAKPKLTVKGTSRVVESGLSSLADGMFSFGVVAGEMGLDEITASVGDAKVEFGINIISLRATSFQPAKVVEGVVPWEELLSAQLKYTQNGTEASFSAYVKAKAGEVVKVSGFMMPLDPDLKQKHFLLTSSPPSCFFHVPGGPAGSIEVVATEGVEVSWEPVLLEGRFEPQETSEIGVVYRLLDAKVVNI